MLFSYLNAENMGKIRKTFSQIYFFILISDKYTLQDMTNTFFILRTSERLIFLGGTPNLLGLKKRRLNIKIEFYMYNNLWVT